MEQGHFIVFEGGDGSGKDTQIELLRQRLTAAGIVDRFLFVRDPGSTEIGETLRTTVLHDRTLSKTTNLFLYLAIRAQLAEEKIRPALEKGMTVISNRFDLSTIAYQIYGRSRHDLLPFLRQMSDYAQSGVRPDTVVYLDCPIDVALARAASRGEHDTFEAEARAFHERVREGYLLHLKDYPVHHVIDASANVEDVARAVQDVLGI